jgi:MinD-like ATPase involved in chromosome partitioning or flagellar assembly
MVDDDPRQLAEQALRWPGAFAEPIPRPEPQPQPAASGRPEPPVFEPRRPEAPRYDSPAAPRYESPEPPRYERPAAPRYQSPRPWQPAAAYAEPAPRRPSYDQPPAQRLVDPFELLSVAEPIDPNGSLDARDGLSNPRPGQSNDQQPLSRRDVLQNERGPAPNRGSLDPRQILDRLGQGRRAPVGAELGQAVLACKPVVAAVVSRKGGVGKTASAAAVAAILGEAVDPFGHTAALVDANVGNPDAWGRLDVRGSPTTMREVVRSLMSGMEPPGPAFAETPALAVYPESREAGDGYAPAQIQRVAAYLKARHAAVVVDLPNRLPAFTSAEAAVAAAWIGEADVLVLPTTADPTALLGAIEYLDADSVQGKPVVVSYIVPRVRQIRDAPQVRSMLDRIRASVAAVVEVPDDDRATLALIQRVAITEIGNELRQAYLALAARVVEAAANRHGGWG